MKNERMILQLGGIGAICYGGLLLVYLAVLLFSFRLRNPLLNPIVKKQASEYEFILFSGFN